MDPGQFSIDLWSILYGTYIGYGPPYNMDSGPIYMGGAHILFNGSIFYGVGPYSTAHIQDMETHRIWTSGSKLYGIYIGNMDPDPFSMGSLFYMTPSLSVRFIC